MQPDNRMRPAWQRTASKVIDGEEDRFQGTRTRRQSSYVVDAERHRYRVLQDALYGGLAVCHERRALALLAAVSRPEDFLGAATPAEVSERDRRLQADAERCLRHAALLREGGDLYSEDLRNVLAGVTS